MRQFFQHLRRAWHYAKYMPDIAILDHEDAWTPDDARNYSHFMTSVTGEKLRLRATKLAVHSAVNATTANVDPVHRNGWASGITATLQWFDGHLVREKPVEESEEAALERKHRRLFSQS